jgi:protein-S-isoprenylcysteine O-methyltransferase Ste14
VSEIYSHPDLVLMYLWGAWALSWFAASRWSAPTQKRVGASRELPYRIVLFIGAFMFFVPDNSGFSGIKLWSLASLSDVWPCAALALAGFSFCWWARIHLGRLWSSNVQKKDDHRIIDTGPYALVRHPIYTGLLLAIFATMVARGTLLALIGASLMTLSIWLKARLEEDFLREELGAETYESYRRRVPMLVPLGPK